MEYVLIAIFIFFLAFIYWKSKINGIARSKKEELKSEGFGYIFNGNGFNYIAIDINNFRVKLGTLLREECLELYLNQIHKHEWSFKENNSIVEKNAFIFKTTNIEHPLHIVNYGSDKELAEEEWAKIEAIFANCAINGQQLKVYKNRNMEFDFFISHASEDKEDIVRPLAISLTDMGYRVWYDEFTLKIGDSLRRSIDQGLSKSRYGIVVLSKSFFLKQWPQYELDGLVTEDISRGKVILPIWHGVDQREVAEYSPSLADKVAFTTRSMTIQIMANQLSDLVKISG